MQKIWLVSRWLLIIYLPLMSLQPGIFLGKEKMPVVVLSPGHGWRVNNSEKIDPGAVNGDLVEKDINLEVARYARDYLIRCPVNVHLTRNSDDPDHTLRDVSEIVNGYDPTIGVSIHTNSGSGHPTGTEGWYTVGGYNDEESKQLAASLADQISSRLKIPNRGSKPEIKNPRKGLYIHTWNAPSALVEIAFLQGDAELLRSQKDDFGRAIAHAILEYLGIDTHCADWAEPQGLFVSTYFPGDTKTNEVALRNDGLLGWRAFDYFLVNPGNEFGADVQYPLYSDTPVKDLATWDIPAIAPTRPGIYRQEWQLVRGSEQVGKKATVYMIVVPEEARQLKEDIDRQIEELRKRGEQEIEKFIEQLEKEALDWVTRELPNLLCGQQVLLITFAVGTIFVIRNKRR